MVEVLPVGVLRVATLPVGVLPAVDTSGGGSSNGNHCPSAYDVPHRYINCDDMHYLTTNTDSKGNASVTVGGKLTTQAGFDKNKTIPVVVCVFNCSKVQQWACCKQSDVKVTIAHQ